jgi:DNA polymerase III epsilon subunit-like protein
MNRRRKRVSYVVLDIETTDLDRLGGAIVEVAALKVSTTGQAFELAELVRPRVAVKPGAFAAHGLSDELLASEGKGLRETLARLVDFIGDLPVVAHNGLGFDFPFLFNEAARAGVTLGDNRLIDTLPLARESIVTETGRYRLGDLAAAVGHHNPRPHRALSDVHACNAVWRTLLERNSDIEAHWQACSARTWQSLLTLPEGYELLAQAIEADQDVEIDYEGTKKPERRRWIRPRRFAVGSGKACYVVAVCCESGTEKHFRFDRINKLLQTRAAAA